MVKICEEVQLQDQSQAELDCCWSSDYKEPPFTCRLNVCPDIDGQETSRHDSRYSHHHPPHNVPWGDAEELKIHKENKK